MSKLLANSFNIALFGLMLYGIYWGLSRIIQTLYFVN